MSISIISLKRVGAVVACASFCFFASFVHAANRPVPEIVNVKTFAKINGDELELLVRVPLAAVKDIQFPTRDDGDTLNLSALNSMLPGAAKYWITDTLAIFDNGVAVQKPQVADTRISISSDHSFDSYSIARAHFQMPTLGSDEQVFWRQVWFDIRFTYRLEKTESHLIAIEPKFGDLGVRVIGEFTYVRDPEESRRYSFDGSFEKIYLDPRWIDTARQFVSQGVKTVATRPDFLLLLFCLALPFRRYRDFWPIFVTFASAFSIAMLLEGLGFVPSAIWFDLIVEVFAAMTVLLTAFANIVGRVTTRRRGLFAMIAGAVFGLSTAIALDPSLQLAADNVATARIIFGATALIASIGIQAFLIPTMTALFSFGRVEVVERIIVSALAADTAWTWLSDRATRLAKIPFQIEWSVSTAALGLRVLAGITLAVGIAWFVDKWLRSHSGMTDEVSTKAVEQTR